MRPKDPIRYDPSVEQVEPDERETAEALLQTLLEISDTTWADTGRGLRSVHAKSHGLLKGYLSVAELHGPLAQGLFARPHESYPVLIRLSTTPGDLLDDRVSTPRGFAMKAIGVQGERLPGSEGEATQDFLLVNGPVFSAASAKQFLASLKLLAATTDRVPRLKRAFSTVLQQTEKAIEALGAESKLLKGLGGHPQTHILGETFFSAVPFLYGEHMAKWQVAPVSPALLALKDRPVDLSGNPDGLRAAVVDYFAEHGAEWDLRVQLCTDLATMPIEDATVRWPEAESPFLTVGRIIVPPQPAWDEDRAAALDDGLSFSPWHGLAAHRPLGSINRARRIAYAGSAGARSPRGRCPVHEPLVAETVG